MTAKHYLLSLSPENRIFAEMTEEESLIFLIDNHKSQRRLINQLKNSSEKNIEIMKDSSEETFKKDTEKLKKIQDILNS